MSMSISISMSVVADVPGVWCVEVQVKVTVCGWSH